MTVTIDSNNDDVTLDSITPTIDHPDLHHGQLEHRAETVTVTAAEDADAVQ